MKFLNIIFWLIEKFFNFLHNSTTEAVEARRRKRLIEEFLKKERR